MAFMAAAVTLKAMEKKEQQELKSEIMDYPARLTAELSPLHSDDPPSLPCRPPPSMALTAAVLPFHSLEADDLPSPPHRSPPSMASTAEVSLSHLHSLAKADDPPSPPPSLAAPVHPAFFGPGEMSTPGLLGHTVMLPSPGTTIWSVATAQPPAWRGGGLPEDSSLSVAQAIGPRSPSAAALHPSWRPVEMLPSPGTTIWSVATAHPPAWRGGGLPEDSSLSVAQAIGPRSPSAAALHPRWRPVEMLPSPGMRHQPHPLGDWRSPGTSTGTAVHRMQQNQVRVRQLESLDVKPASWSNPTRLREAEGRPMKESWIVGSSASHVAPNSTSNRPLPYRCPALPKGGSHTELLEWNKACRRINELAANDPFTYPPILRETKDSDTVSAVTSSRDKTAVHSVAQCIVNISSFGPEEVPIEQFTGIVIGTFEAQERARILTCSEPVCDDNGKLLVHKLRVRLPNKAIKDGALVFYDPYYGLALVEISADMPLRGPSFVSSPKYGKEVFVLARDESSSLMAKKGSVLWHEEPYMDHNYYFYLSCEPASLLSVVQADQ